MENPQLIVSLVTDLGAFGFILWLIQRTFSHTIPRLAKDFQDAVAAMQVAFEKSTDKQREDFREIVLLQRKDFERVLQREQEIHAVQTDKIVQALENLAGKISNVPS